MRNEPWWKNIPAEPATPEATAKLQRSKKGPFIIFAAFAAVIVCMVAFLSGGPNPAAPHKGDFQSVAYPSSAEAIVTECGETYTFKPSSDFYGYVPNDFFLNEEGTGYTPKRITSHPMIVPSFGFMSEDVPQITKVFYTPEDGTNIPNREQVIRLIWSGKIIVWYVPDVDGPTKESIKKFVSENKNFIALPWQADRDLPSNRKFAFSAWTITKSCELWNKSVASAFEKFVVAHPVERDLNNPPKAKYDETTKELPLIEIPK